ELIVGAIVLAVLAVIAYFVVRRSLRPLRRVESTAAALRPRAAPGPPAPPPPPRQRHGPRRSCSTPHSRSRARSAQRWTPGAVRWSLPLPPSGVDEQHTRRLIG
ncbi:hypothetical protein, partial [Nocardia abscessus]|uniref:hypothetical protein n=1 Tax=Nocardia abscessus TaxID=120957 RepID=UPI0024561FD4